MKTNRNVADKGWHEGEIINKTPGAVLPHYTYS